MPETGALISTGEIAGIPVRNLWLLLLYASQLYRHIGAGKAAIEENPDEIPDLVAEILSRMVEKRLMRNLTYGHRLESAVLSRVRGRIELLRTERSQLLRRGKVACRFDALTVDTPRNRYVRAALKRVAPIVKRQELAHRCRLLSTTLGRMGVSAEKPARSELGLSRCDRQDANDQLMVHAAQLAFDLVVPLESPGLRLMALPNRDVVWMRQLYEKAVAGFYDFVLTPQGWAVTAGTSLACQIDGRTAGIDAILPSMRTDVVLTNKQTKRQTIIDTKFTSILVRGRFNRDTLRSGYIYQIYAYLRSQERSDDSMSTVANGLLLHPSLGQEIDETVVIQGHPIRFATVDLAASAQQIRQRLLQLVATNRVI